MLAEDSRVLVVVVKVYMEAVRLLVDAVSVI